MKIVGFSQLRDELKNGNLDNWFKCMIPICDYIYIFDQNSTDGSLDYYKKFNNVTVIESKVNRFTEELLCKVELLDKIKIDHPDTDFIMWLDGDELIDGRLLKNNGQVFKDLCKDLLNDNYDGYFFGHKNLWRSDTYERLDNYYDYMDITGVCKLWKFSMNLIFEKNVGLHRQQYPINLYKKYRLDFSLIHRGFATDNQIISKYENYKSNGQEGWALNRMMDESNLKVCRINSETLPDWFVINDDVNPTTKKRIYDIHNQKNIEIISLIYKSKDYLNLIYNELISDNCKVDGWNVGVRLVLNDATDEIIEEIKKLNINYTIYNDSNPNEYYINRVYRCLNYAAQTSDYDNICFVNSDMVFSKNWLKNLLKHHDGINIPCSRLVESGKLRSGKHAISSDFGRTPISIKYDEFYKYVDNISINEIQSDGLYMPYIINKKRFVDSGMYPEGNIYTTGIGNFGDQLIDSGDNYFFNKLKTQYSMKHITVFDSIVYHIQEGEKDS